MSENLPNEKPAFDPSIQTEDIAFKPDELIVCDACGRQNPPNRVKCLYCAAVLSAAQATDIKPHFRKLEIWEKGWNVILRSAEEPANLKEAAAYLSSDLEHLSRAAELAPLPLARVDNEVEANIVVDALAKYGLHCSVIGDVSLDAEKLPVRLSAISFKDDVISLTNFNTHQTTTFTAAALVLIVSGTIETNKVDTMEKRRRGKETKLLDETATSSDEAVIDIYRRGDGIGYRIQATGFDFSCLGDDKGILAGENMRRLIILLAENAPNAKRSNAYGKVRHLLDNVWELESRKDPQGLRRAGFARKEFGTVATTSNLIQFTKYSRLQRHLR